MLHLQQRHDESCSYGLKIYKGRTLMVNDERDGEPDPIPDIADAQTSASYQDGSSSYPADETAPDDAGSTSAGRGLTDGGTDTAIDVHGDITKGGMAGDYGDGGSTVG